MSDAMKKHPEADVLINFASLRSAYESTMETLAYPQVFTKILMKNFILRF
jgi:ATP citrate (pro-S)-lyase